MSDTPVWDAELRPHLTPYFAYGAAFLIVAAHIAVGIDLDDVFKVLEDEAVDKFVVSWGDLIDAVKGALAKS